MVEAIAAIENVESTELSMTLHDYVNPETLNRLVTEETDVTVEFSVDEYHVKINGDQLTITFD